MKTITKETIYYTIHELKELSIRAFYRAHSRYLQYDDSQTSLCFQDTKDAFEKLIGNKKYLDENTLNLSGVRALAWIENNIVDELEKKGKYIGYNKSKAIYSKVQKVMDCPLTGVYSDMSIIDCIDRFRKSPDNKTVEQFLDDVEQQTEIDYQKAIEYEQSGEYFIENCDANEYYFDINGNLE